VDKLAPDQRNHYYLTEASRTGIHRPILVALHTVQQQPPLSDGETGLGIVPIHQVELSQVETFPDQVRWAANTLRRLTHRLVNQGWASTDLWDVAAGRYSDRFLEQVAQGYGPTVEESDAAQVEPCDKTALRQAYLHDLTATWGRESPHQRQESPNMSPSFKSLNVTNLNLSQLDPALLTFAERVSPNYSRITAQRLALVEAVRIWQQVDTVDAVYEALAVPVVDQVPDETALDHALLAFMTSALETYAGYPHQREALLRLAQHWLQRDTREGTIIALLTGDPFAPAASLPSLDPVLMAFVQTLPSQYQGQGDQRFALTEAYRSWFSLESRNAALQRLGINPDDLVAQADNPTALMATAQTLDRALIDFVQIIPTTYAETEDQREILMILLQRWRRLNHRTTTVQALLEDRRQMERAAPHTPEAIPAPVPPPLPPRPPRWTPNNLQLWASIVPNGHFTWAEATRGGVRMPPNQTTVDAIVRLAALAQQARERLGRPWVITSWYHPTPSPTQGESPNRHGLGDAMDFYCVGLTGSQVYWFLDPWWPGGLGRYRHYPHLVHVDARPHRARWAD
jgi:hypothetical protein